MTRRQLILATFFAYLSSTMSSGCFWCRPFLFWRCGGAYAPPIHTPAPLYQSAPVGGPIAGPIAGPDCVGCSSSPAAAQPILMNGMQPVSGYPMQQPVFMGPSMPLGQPIVKPEQMPGQAGTPKN